MTSLIDSALPPPKSEKGEATEGGWGSDHMIINQPNVCIWSQTENSVRYQNFKAAIEHTTTVSEDSHTGTLHPSHLHTPGEVMLLGQGDVGWLGLGEDVVERKKPFPVKLALKGKNAVQVSCREMHTVALTDNAKVGCEGAVSAVMHTCHLLQRFIGILDPCYEKERNCRLIVLMSVFPFVHCNSNL